MERNIDRNLRMAKREARRFFGLSRRRLEGGAFIVTILLFVSAFYLPENPARLFEGPMGWLLLTGIVIVIAAISYISVRGFPFHAWVRGGRPEKPRYRRWPHWPN